MAGIRLQLDPTAMMAGAAQAKSAIESIAAEAISTESRLLAMGNKGKELNKIKIGLDPVYAAALKATASIKDLDALLGAGAISAAQYTAKMASIKGSLDKIATSSAGVSGVMGRFGPQMQQVGFQVGDFATQVGAGTSAAQALGQQLPQLLGGFGAVGAIIGAVAAIAIPLGAALWNMESGAVSLEDAMGDLTDASSDYAEAARNARMSLSELRGEFGDGASEAQELYEILRTLAELKFADKLASAGLSLTEDLGGITEALRGVSASEKLMQGPLRETGLDLLKTSMQDLNSEFGIGVVEAKRISAAMDALATAQGPAEVAAAARELLDAITATADESGKIPEALQPAAQTAGEIAMEAIRLRGDLGRSADEATRLASTDMVGGISAAGAAASFLANEMARAVGNATSLAGAGLSALKESQIRLQYVGKPVELAGALAGARYDASVGAVPQVEVGGAGAVGAAIIRENRDVVVQSATQTAINQQQEQAAVKALAALGKGAGGGGGGGANEAEKAAKAYDSLLGSLDPIIRADQEFAKAQQTVNAALDAGYISAEQAANTISLAREEMDKAKASAEGAAGAWQDMWDAGGSAIDALIAGTGKLSDVLKQALVDMVALITKRALLGSVAGATDSDSLGTIIAKGLFGGFFDNGGAMAIGSVGIVGERGPELVASTSRGAVVTSRTDTAAMRGGGQVEVIGGDLQLSDSGQIFARMQVVARQAAFAAGQAAINETRRNLGGWNQQLNTDGALV